MDFAGLVRKFAAAAASGNGDALADLFTPDGTYDDYFFGPSSGREAIKKMLAHFAEGGSNSAGSSSTPLLPATPVTPATASPSIPSDRRPTARGSLLTASAASTWRVGAFAAIRKCSIAAWPWPSRSSSRIVCARSA